MSEWDCHYDCPKCEGPLIVYAKENGLRVVFCANCRRDWIEKTIGKPGAAL